MCVKPEHRIVVVVVVNFIKHQNRAITGDNTGDKYRCIMVDPAGCPQRQESDHCAGNGKRNKAYHVNQCCEKLGKMNKYDKHACMLEFYTFYI